MDSDPAECAEFLTLIDANSAYHAELLAQKYLMEKEQKFVRGWEMIVDFDGESAVHQSYVTKTQDDFPFVIGSVQLQFVQTYKE
jgi:hypothetical protein